MSTQHTCAWCTTKGIAYFRDVTTALCFLLKHSCMLVVLKGTQVHDKSRETQSSCSSTLTCMQIGQASTKCKKFPAWAFSISGWIALYSRKTSCVDCGRGCSLWRMICYIGWTESTEPFLVVMWEPWPSLKCQYSVTAPEPVCRSIHAKKLRRIGCKSPSPSCFSVVNMKVIVQAEASFIAVVFRFKRLTSLSTRLLW